jgi:hypothetical protein
MARAHGIQTHKVFKLGKAAAERDSRNLLFASILRAPVKVPDEYDFDVKHPGIATPMFGNDKYGDCVMAGRAHQTLRFELIEQGAKLTITDREVVGEYLKETGGRDAGLVVLESLKLWRRRGWLAAKRRYKIQAFSEIRRSSREEIKRAIFLDAGVGLGLSLPTSASAQIQAGKPWDVTGGPGSAKGSWGGHYVYVSGYTKLGPVCVTWGRKQQITWAFFNKYCDEAYAIIDAVDTAKKRKGLDEKKIKAFLSGLRPQRR